MDPVPFSKPQSATPSLPGSMSLQHIHTLKAQLMLDDEKKFQEYVAHLPPPGHPEYYIRRNWITHLAAHKFTVACDFVAQLGHAVHIIDVRLENELTGPVGYIPGINWFPRTDIGKIISSFPADALLAIVCMNDSDSREVVAELKAHGRVFAAVMSGGMRAWKLMGFSTSRDPSILARRGVVHSKALTAPAPKDRFGRRTMSLQQISDHIGNGEGIQWIKMAAFMVHGRMSCIDGRDDCGVIGTPGGDMGEFIIALTAAEELMNRHLTDADVAVLFQRRLDAFGRFYMHTDQACLDKLVDAVRKDPELVGVFSPSQTHVGTSAFLMQVPNAARERMLEHLTNPAHIGCGHLRFMLTKSETYKVRRELVLTALRCFFYAMWDGATEGDYVVLAGQHEECGVANVSLVNDVHSFTRIPLIPPSIQGNQIFVNHEQISAYLRKQQAEWFIGQDDILPLSKNAAAAYLPFMNLLADQHVNVSLGALAANMPLYTLRFDDTGFCEVHYNGIVAPPAPAPEPTPVAAAAPAAAAATAPVGATGQPVRSIVPSAAVAAAPLSGFATAPNTPAAAPYTAASISAAAAAAAAAIVGSGSVTVCAHGHSHDHGHGLASPFHGSEGGLSHSHGHTLTQVQAQVLARDIAQARAKAKAMALAQQQGPPAAAGAGTGAAAFAAAHGNGSMNNGTNADGSSLASSTPAPESVNAASTARPPLSGLGLCVGHGVGVGVGQSGATTGSGRPGIPVSASVTGPFPGHGHGGSAAGYHSSATPFFLPSRGDGSNVNGGHPAGANPLALSGSSGAVSMSDAIANLSAADRAAAIAAAAASVSAAANPPPLTGSLSSKFASAAEAAVASVLSRLQSLLVLQGSDAEPVGAPAASEAAAAVASAEERGAVLRALGLEQASAHPLALYFANQRRPTRLRRTLSISNAAATAHTAAAAAAAAAAETEAIEAAAAIAAAAEAEMEALEPIDSAAVAAAAAEAVAEGEAATAPGTAGTHLLAAPSTAAHCNANAATTVMAPTLSAIAGMPVDMA